MPKVSFIPPGDVLVSRGGLRLTSEEFMNGPTKPGDFGDPVADSIRREQQQDAAPHPDEIREPSDEEQRQFLIENLEHDIHDCQRTIRDVKRNLVLAESENEREALIEVLEHNIEVREEKKRKLQEVKEDAQDAA